MMARVLVLAAFVWPLVLGAAVWAGHGPAQSWTASVYMAASRICHQRPDRSFFTAGVQWPVCGRCSGLYLAAPVGAVLAVAGHRRRSTPQTARTLVAAAALPTIVTLGLEWLQLTAVSNLARAAAAAPLGAAIAWVLVRVAEPRVH